MKCTCAGRNETLNLRDLFYTPGHLGQVSRAVSLQVSLKLLWRPAILSWEKPRYFATRSEANRESFHSVRACLIHIICAPPFVFGAVPWLLEVYLSQ